jgi:hypothetical protein
MNLSNKEKLEAALAVALADTKFMGNNDKVDKAIDALTPKTSVTATLKRLQGNALRDFLQKKDAKVVGYTEQTRADKIKEYVFDRFKVYMEDSKTSEEATKLFYAAYPPATEPPVELGKAA